MSKRIFKTFLLTVALTLGCFTANAETIIAPSPTAKMDGENKSVVMYGNSFTYSNKGLPKRLRDLTSSILRNNAEGYTFQAVTKSTAHLALHQKQLHYQNTLQLWDVVVFQGHSMEPISPKESTRENFEKSAKTMAKIAHRAGSKVVYFMTWARKTHPEQTEEISKAYQDIAKETGGYVAPVGLAFAESIKRYPEIELYRRDGKHPTQAGTYLAAAVFFTTLYNRSPLGGAVPVGTNMSDKTARRLQIVAWETVQRFQANTANTLTKN